MSNEALVSSQINSVINNLADKLHVPINEIMSALMMQAKISSISDILSMILISTVFYFSLRIFLRENAKLSHDSNNNEASCWISLIITIIFGIVFIICAISVVMYLDVILAGFFNPEYWALHNILSLLRSPCRGA
ncbi:MAG: hypothetical protein WC495_05575 [Patescibacteria group bacterium]